MDDPFLMRMLHRRTDLREQVQPLGNRKLVLVAEVDQRDALDQFHHEERCTRFGRPCVEQFGNVRVIHHRDGLPLGLEAGEDGLRLPALGTDELDGDFAFDRFGLVGHPDRSHPAFANLLP
jgi:hypothetical protein